MFPWNWMIDLFTRKRCQEVWSSDLDQREVMWWDDTARVSYNVRKKMNRKRVEKVVGEGAERLCEDTVCTLCVHTSVWEKPCLRKMQAGPTMLCSMLQFFTKAPTGSLNGLASTSWSSSPSGCRPCWAPALTLPRRGPSITPFRDRPAC